MTGQARTILRIQYGSHLYGTSTPDSDLDRKSIFVPDARDILLGRVKGSVSTGRAKSPGEKNHAGEAEEEAYSVQRFLDLLAEGQTVALDMVFAPPWSRIGPVAPEWCEIAANRHRLVSRRSAGFVGYCRQQASRYGLKGSRVAAARAALALLDAATARLGTAAKLEGIGAEVRAFAARTEHVSIVAIAQASGAMLDHLDVCGRKLSFRASIRQGCDVLRKLVDEYGHRALQAETQQGVDWKALSHAVRVASQGIELFETGHVTFPLPNAAHVLAVKLGRVPYGTVAAEIDDLLLRVEAASARSDLPEEPDRSWIDDFVVETHRRAVTV